MKSYKKSLCALVLVIFLVTFFTIGLVGCCSTNYQNGGTLFGGKPEYQGPRTVEEYMAQPRPSIDLTNSK